jgi:hypothetical protein
MLLIMICLVDRSMLDFWFSRCSVQDQLDTLRIVVRTRILRVHSIIFNSSGESLLFFLNFPLSLLKLFNPHTVCQIQQSASCEQVKYGPNDVALHISEEFRVKVQLVVGHLIIEQVTRQVLLIGIVETKKAVL